MGLDMMGHVSGPFVTHTVEHRRYSNSYVNHKPALTLDLTDTFAGNVQAASDREIEFLSIAGERINDARVIHRNDGKGIAIGDYLLFSTDPANDAAIWWKCIDSDFRPWHNFSRATVARMDPQKVTELLAKVTA